MNDPFQASFTARVWYCGYRGGRRRRRKQKIYFVSIQPIFCPYKNTSYVRLLPCSKLTILYQWRKIWSNCCSSSHELRTYRGNKVHPQMLSVNALTKRCRHGISSVCEWATQLSRAWRSFHLILRRCVGGEGGYFSSFKDSRTPPPRVSIQGDS